MPVISLQETEAVGSGVQGHPWLLSKFEVSPGYRRFYLKKKKKRKEGNIANSLETFHIHFG